jgi:polysaccharide biosynthesis protein PslH
MTNVLSVVSYSILPAKTGGQRSVTLFNKYFSKYVHLLCVTTRNNDVSLAEGYQVLNILSNAPLRYINPFYFFTLRSVIRKNNISHVLLEHPYYGWLGVLVKWFCGVQLIVRSQNIEGLRWKTLGKSWWKLLWYYEKWVHRQADYNFFIQQDDKSYAIHHFGLHPFRCALVTYGIEQNMPPEAEEKKRAKAYLLQQHAIPSTHHLLLFNGAFNYSPNLNGLKRILNDINPLLNQQKDFPYTIIICGKDIPDELVQQQCPHVIFAGFVRDISVYFTGCDVFLNPVVEGGGIKTKLVEALGYNMNVVSSASGAIGVDPALCNGKLMITDDHLNGFVESVMLAAQYQANITPEYYHHFYWGHITQQAAAFIKGGKK